MNNTIDKALIFAYKAHKNQKRKYTNEPYIVHPIGVAALVEEYLGDNQNLIAAALLHDVVEDTDYTIQDIKKEFGSDIAKLVLDLTDVSKPEDGNRLVRKTIDRKHTLSASYDAKNIKLCDLIHNCESIVLHDKDFAKVYLKEFSLLLSLLKGYTDDVLWNEAQQLLIEGLYKIKGDK